jgi:dTDP-4-amino-4,6-dideoxygalactose transaminase
LQSAVTLAQFERLPRLLAHYRRIQTILEEEVRPCKTFTRAPGHDREGEVGWTFNLKFSSNADVVRFEKALRAEGVPNCSTYETRFIAPGEVVVVPSGEPWTEKAHTTADGWAFLHERRGITKSIDPWANSKITYDPKTIMAPSVERLNKLLAIRINPKLTDEHARLIGAAIKKVDRSFAR